MTYPRFLYTEFEQPNGDDEDGGCTIFSTHQSWGRYCRHVVDQVSDMSLKICETCGSYTLPCA